VATVATIYDNTAGSGTVIAIITAGAGASSQVFCQQFDVAFATGLTITTTVAGTDATVSYQ